MKKKGISTIVATVLTVLIGVAAVTLLWAGVYPIIEKTYFVDDINVKFTIDKSESYTVYDPENGLLRVRAKRGADNSEVVALKFVIDIAGDSKVRRVTDVMNPNAAKVYTFSIGFADTLDSVKLIPIYLINGEEIEGRTFFIEEKIPVIDHELDSEIGEGVDGVELSEGLIFYYSFDDPPTEDDEVMDLSGYGHKGTTFGGITFLEDGGIPDRDLGGAYEFDGVDGHIALMTLPSGESLDTEEKTIAFWAKPDCKPESSIFGSYENYQITFSDVCGLMPFIPNSDSIITDFSDESNLPINPYFGSAPIEENNWHHYTITFKITNDNPGIDEDDVTTTLYINGIEEDSILSENIGYGTVDTNFYMGTTAVNIAGNPDTTRYFKGIIDEFRIYNRILDEGEITQLHNIKKE